jgi:AAA ATPase-like protein
MAMNEDDQRKRLRLLDLVFRPGAPVDREDLFSGRLNQLASVTEAVSAVGQHAVIFGERGVGKTSLAATCVDIARRQGRVALRVNCDQGDNFHSLWGKVIDEFPVVVEETPADRRDALREATESATEILDLSEVGPNQVRVAFRRITTMTPVVIFFDEFDQIADGGTLNLVSNTIKVLSDQIESVTLVPVGVSDSVDGLIAGHQSIQRNLVQVRMPRMSRDEIEGILDKGLGELEMTVDTQARRFIRNVPRGLPQYAHMLAQEGARQAVLSGEALITFDHVLNGMTVGVSKLDHSLSEAFDEATYSARQSNYADVLYACVLVNPDDSGYFSPASIRAPFSGIVGKRRTIDHYNPNLTKLSQERGQILSRKGLERSRRYRFTDPLMEPYVLLKGISAGRIDPARMLRSDGPSE